MACPAASRRRRERPQLALADVFRQCGKQLQQLDGRQSRVVRAILRCRTAALGGHVEQCNRCDHRRIAYNSCRDRHCPKCQGNRQRAWLEAQCQQLLPIEYHHVVFTVPDTLHALLRSRPRMTYGLLFAAVAETLQDAAGNPKHLGARIGFSCVLHTWTQTLLYHPHIHCIVTGGGLDRTAGAGFRPVAASCFPCAFSGGCSAASCCAGFNRPSTYTHRVAISNHRLVALDDQRVSFRWNDRACGDTQRLMTLDVAEFLRRFLLHLLPPGLMRIRHFGLLANPNRQRDLTRCRECIATDPLDDELRQTGSATTSLGPAARDGMLCPRCPVPTAPTQPARRSVLAA